MIDFLDIVAGIADFFGMLREFVKKAIMVRRR